MSTAEEILLMMEDEDSAEAIRNVRRLGKELVAVRARLELALKMARRQKLRAVDDVAFWHAEGAEAALEELLEAITTETGEGA